MSTFKVVIPARYASERLPGKPLRDINGAPMIEHVYRRACASKADEVIVATDDERIAGVVREFGGIACMTAREHTSGTERLAEVCTINGWDDEVCVVNLQGDEPLMPAELIDQCAGLLDDRSVHVSTLASAFKDAADFRNPNVVKVVCAGNGNALYFSRAPIPHARDASESGLAVATALQHHGIYGYRVAVLRQLVATAAVALEQTERLEQLRALHLGMTIRVGKPRSRPGPGVDTEGDLQAVAALLRGK
jgi:3-deoxy-manno-octulosonate cytidylyltransferase (CMP-KDO synthetase)